MIIRVLCIHTHTTVLLYLKLSSIARSSRFLLISTSCKLQEKPSYGIWYITVQWNLSIGTTWSVLIEGASLFQRLFVYTSLRSWDNRLCPDWRGVLISEIPNREVTLYAAFLQLFLFPVHSLQLSKSKNSWEFSSENQIHPCSVHWRSATAACAGKCVLWYYNWKLVIWVFSSAGIFFFRCF